MDLSWEKLSLHPHILHVIEGFGFEHMTPVQVSLLYFDLVTRC